MMNTRERILSLAVLGIVGSYGLFLVVQRAFLSPLDAQDTLIRRLKTDISVMQKDMDRAIRATGQIAEWEKLSLPPDEGDAKALYQAYLFKLMGDCHISESDYSINTQKVHTGKYYTTIPFNIRGKASLENLTDLLYSFEAHKKVILHEIRNATINRSAEPGGKIQFTLEVAALALKTAPFRERLIPDDTKFVLDAPRDTYKLIASKNIFEPYKPATAPRIDERPREPVIDAAEHIVFSGFTDTGDETLAWFYNRLTKDNKQYRTGDELDLGGVKGKIVNISYSAIVLERDGKQWNLKLGKKLKELTLVALANSSTSAGDDEKPESAKPESEKSDTEKRDAEKTSDSSATEDRPAAAPDSVDPPKSSDDSREKLGEFGVTAEKTTESTNGVRKVKSED